MKRWKLCDLVPPGTSGELQGLLCLLVMICAFLYSVWKYAAALTHGLETAARSLHRMTDFADLIGAQSDRLMQRVYIVLFFCFMYLWSWPHCS